MELGKGLRPGAEAAKSRIHIGDAGKEFHQAVLLLSGARDLVAPFGKRLKYAAVHGTQVHFHPRVHPDSSASIAGHQDDPLEGAL